MSGSVKRMHLKVLILVMQWLRCMEPLLTTGKRACLHVLLIPKLRLLNKACLELWSTKIDVRIGKLLALCINDRHISPAFFNNAIKLQEKDVQLVAFMLQFKRSSSYSCYLSKDDTVSYLATASYDLSGAVSWVSSSMVDHLHLHFQRNVQIAKVMDQRRPLVGLWRSISVPRVRDLKKRNGKRSPHSRSKSLPIPRLLAM